MSDATSPLWLWLVLIFIIFSRVSSADQENITAEAGQTVILTCRAPNNIISIVEWNRAGLGEKHVFVCRDGRILQNEQHPYFEGRVDLHDRQDGDVSVILKNLTVNDTGTYECRVRTKKTSSLELMCSINLVVAPPAQPGGLTKDGGKEDGSVGVIVGLSVPAVLLLVLLIISRRCRKQQVLDPKQPPDEQQHTCKENLLIKVEP